MCDEMRETQKRQHYQISAEQTDEMSAPFIFQHPHVPAHKTKPSTKKRKLEAQTDVSVQSHDTKERIAAIFSDPYKLKTFKRKSFTKQDRLKVWHYQAMKEYQIWLGLKNPPDGDFNFDAAQEAIEEMGLTAQGIHLRHVIPYSDIAAVMHIVTSQSIRKSATDEDREAIKFVVSKIPALIDLLYADEDSVLAETMKDKFEKIQAVLAQDENPLLSSINRELLGHLTAKIANAKMNLFHGGSSANMAISNRFDANVFAVGLLGSEHVKALMQWWFDVMSALGTEPQEKLEKIVHITFRGRYANGKEHWDKELLTVPLYSHNFSRTVRPVSGSIDEMEMTPK